MLKWLAERGRERNLQKALSAKYKKPLQKISWIELTVNHSNLKSLGCALAKVESGSVGINLIYEPEACVFHHHGLQSPVKF